MDDNDPKPRSALRRALLGGGWSVGIVLGVLAASMMPAWRLFDPFPEPTPPMSRVLAMVASVGVLVAVLLLAGPRLVAWMAAHGVLASPPPSPEGEAPTARIAHHSPRR